MSSKLTTVRPRKGRNGVGFTDHGTHSREEMIAQMRRHYQRQLEEAQYALELSDDELIVETHTGVYRRRNVKEVT